MDKRDYNSLMRTFITAAQMIPHCLGILIKNLLGSLAGPMDVFSLVLEYLYVLPSLVRLGLHSSLCILTTASYSCNHRAFLPWHPPYPARGSTSLSFNVFLRLYHLHNVSLCLLSQLHLKEQRLFSEPHKAICCTLLVLTKSRFCCLALQMPRSQVLFASCSAPGLPWSTS